MSLRVYRLMNLGVGEENAGKFGKLGSPFAICDACLPMYAQAVTNNEDSRLVEDVGVRSQEPCSYHGHPVKP